MVCVCLSLCLSVCHVQTHVALPAMAAAAAAAASTASNLNKNKRKLRHAPYETRNTSQHMEVSSKGYERVEDTLEGGVGPELIIFNICQWSSRFTHIKSALPLCRVWY